MSGNATFSGTTYQSRIITFVYVHILAQRPLGWLGTADDTPLGISGEVGGPGDDARIEFAEGRAAVEVQAKHGLTAGAKLDEVIECIRDAETPKELDVILTVDRSSSRALYTRFKTDLDRLRSGRSDGLGPECSRILKSRQDAAGALKRLRVVPVDVDAAHDPESMVAFGILQSIVEDAEQVKAAWGVLANDADDLCARKLRRTRKNLLDLLVGAGIKLQPTGKDARWHQQLNFSRQLLERRHAAAALTDLSKTETTIGDLRVEPRVQYRLSQQRAAAYLQLGHHADSLLHARKALDIDPNGVHALVVAAFATLPSGDLAAAHAFVDRAIAAECGNPLGWAAKAYMCNASGDPNPTPPPEVAESGHYRTSLAQLAVECGDSARALELTGALLRDGIRSPDVLLVRANALANADVSSEHSSKEQRFQDVERFTSELLDIISDESHPYTQRALVLRAMALRALGREDEARQDLNRAHEIAPNDAEVIGHLAQRKHDSGDNRGALEVLLHPVVDRSPLLLALRAQIRARLKDDARARTDLDAALRQVADALDPDILRFAAADAAVALKDPDSAERCLQGVTSKGIADVRYPVLKGRVEFARGNIEVGARLYKEAASNHPVERIVCLTELGSKLLQARRPEDAVTAFDAVGHDLLPQGAMRAYASALFEANDLARAQEVIDRIAKSAALPAWALRLATEIALRREDLPNAVEHLKELIEQGQSTASMQLELASHLVELGRDTEAAPYVATVTAMPDLSAVQRMQAAQLLHATGRSEEAIALAFRAYRLAPEDPQLHRAFIVLTMMAHVPLPHVEEIGADTHVRLRNRDGAIREQTIYAEPPINPTHGEMSVEDARAADILGRKIGDVIVENQRTWMERQWTVEAVVPAIQHVVQDAMLHYEERFPGEPFFLTGFQVGDGTSVKDFVPIIASLEARKQLGEQLFTAYRQNTLPLGLIATVLSCTIPDAMAQASLDPEKSGPLFVEWADSEGQEESCSAAHDATEIVLTRSALHTAFAIGILEQLKSSYILIAPRSLHDELRKELSDARKLVSDGRKVVMTGPAGLFAQELEPNHPDLVSQFERLQLQIRWLEQSAQLEARPLETIKAPRSQEEEARPIMGRSSYDAVALAQHRNLTLYADDLGLRRFLPKGSPARSFSTVGLLPALAQRGVLTAEQRDRHLLTLVQSNYFAVPATTELLQVAVQSSLELPRPVLGKAFGLLGGPSMTPGQAARIAARLIRSSATAPLEILPMDQIVKYSLEAMAARWPRPLCAFALQTAAAEELALLPRQLRQVRDICAAFRSNDIGLFPRS